MQRNAKLQSLRSVRNWMGATVTLKESFKAIKENLQAAAAVIRQRGWCQDQGETRWGACCLVRALVLTEGDEPCATLTCNFLRDRFGIENAIKWNDAPGRTKEEVLELLKRAAETA